MPRTTRNSLDANLSSTSLPEPSLIVTQSVSTRAIAPSITSEAIASPVPIPTSTSVATASPELVASLMAAIQAPLTSMVNSALLSAGMPAPSVAGTSSLGHNYANPSGLLNHQAIQLGHTGSPLPWSSMYSPPVPSLSSCGAASASSGSNTNPATQGQGQGMFVSPFGSVPAAPPIANSIGSSIMSARPFWNSSNGQQPPVPAAPALNQSFVVGPGYSPVPYKVVSQIISGKYINLEDLLPENISAQEPEPQLMFDGRLVFSPAPKKPKRQIADIVTWLEAFSVLSLILGSYFPHRWLDLTKYKLLIVRTYRQFSGSAWLNYDREFREHVAAERLTEWSTMNVQLYNFHTAGAHVRPRVAASTVVATGLEPQGSQSTRTICLSWNSGRCVAPSAQCRFRHACGNCGGEHRSSSCKTSSKLHKSERSRSVDPSDNKRRKHF